MNIKQYFEFTWMRLVTTAVTFLFTSLCAAQTEGNVIRSAKDTMLDYAVGIEPFSDDPKENVYDSVDVQAKFPGGDSAFIVFVHDNFEYPPRCLEEELSGFVLLRFVVDMKGRISRITPVETTASCPEFTWEAIRLMKMSPKWIPAQNHGKFVSSWGQVPIRMNLK